MFMLAFFVLPYNKAYNGARVPQTRTHTSHTHTLYCWGKC